MTSVFKFLDYARNMYYAEPQPMKQTIIDVGQGSVRTGSVYTHVIKECAQLGTLTSELFTDS